MKNLVFTAKWIGVRCVRFLLDNFPEDEYKFILCQPGANDIAKLLDDRGYKYHMLGNDVISEIVNKPPGYYDWLLNLWGGYIFKEDTLSKARFSLNIHPAYLPYCRGRDPVVWSIRHGYPAGVTLHQVTLGVDEGPIWWREEIDYSFPIKGFELYKRVAERCISVFAERWGDIRSGKLAPEVQPTNKENYTFKRSDLFVDQCINLESDIASKSLFMRLLAHDFSPDYSAQFVINGRKFNVTLSFSPVNESD